jgi:hypothetical protein
MKTNKGFVVPLLLGIIILLLVGGYFALHKNSVRIITEPAPATNENPNTNENPKPVSSAPMSAKINCEKYYNVPFFGPCLISPDGKLAVAPARDGLRIIDNVGKMTVLSNSRYDLADLWFSDSQRVLGFNGSFPSMGCEGNAIDCPRGVPDNRKIVIWNIKSKTFANVAVQTPPLSYDMEWIVPDHTAFIYAIDMGGAEGSNFYYTLNLDAKTISGPTKNPQLR